MSILKVSNLCYAIKEKVLYNNCQFVLNPKEHVGIVGKNGVGKSTFLKIITHIVDPDDGEIKWQPNIKIGILDQHAEIDKDKTIFEYLQNAFQHLYELEKQMILYYEKSVDDYDLFDKAVQIQSKLEVQNFYHLDIVIEKIANGLGLNAIGLDKKIAELSGGQRAKVILAKLLLEKPDVLLLDEPTNFLDVEHIEWLINYLNEFEGSFLLISHDFSFLNRTTTHILEISNHTFVKYTGNFEAYQKQKELMVDDYEKRFEKQQKQIEKMEDFIRKNIAGSNSKNARGRRKQLERMEKMPPPAKQRPNPTFSFNLINCSPQQKLIVKDLTIGYDFPLIKNINLTISGGEKIVIKGFNGIGKSTLLKTLMNQIKQIDGSYNFSDTIKKIYYEQDFTWENNQELPLSIVKNKYKNMNDKDAFSLLARHGLSNKDILQPVGTLSGGEQAKVKLSLLSLLPTNFIILDEPTNHLDDIAKESLYKALKSFGGTIILVSHEPDFYKDLATKIIDVSKLN